MCSNCSMSTCARTPLLRPLSFHYSDDKFGCDIHDEFLRPQARAGAGADILVLPVLERGKTFAAFIFLAGYGIRLPAARLLREAGCTR